MSGSNATQGAPAPTIPSGAISPSTPAPASNRGGRSYQNQNNGGRNGNNQSRGTNRFVPKIATIESLATSKENKGQDFIKFQKSLHHHVLTTFKRSKDLSKAILEFENPIANIKKDRLTLADIRKEEGLEYTAPTKDETETEKYLREQDNSDNKEMAKTIYNTSVKLHAERLQDLSQNLTILWATIMGQCTPPLQEEISGDPDYIAKSSEFDSIWLLQTLQKVTAGVNKTTNKFHSAFKATKSFYMTQQAYTESLDEYYNRSMEQNIWYNSSTLTS